MGHQIDRQEHRVRYKSVCRSLGICQSVHKDNQHVQKNSTLWIIIQEDDFTDINDADELDHFLLRSTTGHKERKDEKGNNLFHKSS